MYSKLDLNSLDELPSFYTMPMLSLFARYIKNSSLSSSLMPPRASCAHCLHDPPTRPGFVWLELNERSVAMQAYRIAVILAVQRPCYPCAACFEPSSYFGLLFVRSPLLRRKSSQTSTVGSLCASLKVLLLPLGCFVFDIPACLHATQMKYKYHAIDNWFCLFPSYRVNSLWPYLTLK